MSASDLLSLDRVPGLDAAATLLTATYANIQKIALYRKRCEDMAGRAVKLLLQVREVPGELVGTRAQALTDELEPVLQRIKSKTHEWSNWGPLKCFFQQNELGDNLDRLQKELDGAILNFGVAMNLELQRSMYRSEAIHHATQEEIRAGLQAILDDNRELKKLLSNEPQRHVEEVMMGLQKELQDPNIPKEQQQSFRQGLWDLHNKTQRLPPLSNLTGQVELDDDFPTCFGTYNDVYKGTWLGKEEVAVRLPRTLSDSAYKKFQDEVEIWRTFDHPNVLPLYGITYIKRHIHSVSPWMKHGTAISFVKRFPQTNVPKLLSEIAEGLGYLHSQDIVHGDLRGANVLISEDGVARLSDFGLSKFLVNCNNGLTSAAAIISRWVAPEILKEKPLSKESDIWSLGMTFLELFTRQPPYSDIVRDLNVSDEVKKYKLPRRPSDQAVIDAGLDGHMWDLLKQCWKKPENRPTVQTVKLSLARIRFGDPRPQKSLMGSMMNITRSTRKTPSRPSTAGSEGSSSKSTGRLSAGIAGLSLQSMQEYQPEQPNGSMLSPMSHAGASPTSWSSHSPSSSYSPSAYSPTHSTQPTRRASEAQSSQTLWGPMNSRTSFSSHGHDSLTMEHSSAPKLPLLHLEPETSYQPRIRPRAYTDAQVSVGSIVTVQSANQEPLLQNALSSKEPVVYLNSSGAIIAGTLKGLVERLINNISLQKDEEFREIFLVACADLIETERLFDELISRFNEAEEDHPQDKMPTQLNVFRVLHLWLSSPKIPASVQLLSQMRVFCEEAIQTLVSPTMVERADELLDLINERIRRDTFPKTALAPGRRIMQGNEVTPSGLAIALTILEGDKYKAITPFDYLANQCGRPGFNPVAEAASTNNLIIKWTKDSLLHWDGFQQRAAVLKFYINTAQELRKLRNYHSLSAIAIALGSMSVANLEVTKEYLNNRLLAQYEELKQFTDPENNHIRYRKALAEASGPCIPWIAIHLKELHSVLHQHGRAKIVNNNKPVINFHRYRVFMDKLREVLSYPPPDLEQYRSGGELAYLEDKLQGVQLGEEAEVQNYSRGETLREIERNPHSKRVARLEKLGWNVGKAGQGVINGKGSSS